MDPLLHNDRGPFFASQVRDGDYYELVNGHPIQCSPAGRDHTGPNVSGAEVLDTDPDVEWAGVDAGFSPEPGTLRAPDVAVGPPVEKGSGWIAGAPLLAVEYAGAGQDEEKLQEKIRDLLSAGTCFIWVVRLVGPRRVEIYRPDEPVEVVSAGEELLAPGVLRNPVPVEALYDRRAAHDSTFRNLLQRQGYENLDAVRMEGEQAGVASSILILLEARGLVVSDEVRARLANTADLDLLRRWLVRAASAGAVGDVFSGD